MAISSDPTVHNLKLGRHISMVFQYNVTFDYVATPVGSASLAVKDERVGPVRPDHEVPPLLKRLIMPFPNPSVGPHVEDEPVRPLQNFPNDVG